MASLKIILSVIVFFAVRQALRVGLCVERGGHGLGEVDAQDERSRPAQADDREVHDRDCKVLQRGVRAGPTGKTSNETIARNGRDMVLAMYANP